LIMMLMHAMNNTIGGSFFSQMFSGADSVREAWLYAALWCAAAIVVVIVAGPKHLSRKRKKQEEPSEISPKSSVYEAQPEAQPQAH
jgi:hypothetical protein